MRELVASGAFIAGIVVSGIDSPIDDPEVEVRIVRLVLSGCEAGTPGCLPRIDGAFADHAFTEAEPIVVGTGSIVAGRLTATVPQWTVPIGALGLESPVEGADIRLDDVRLSGVLGEGARADGILGAAVAVDEAVRVAVEGDPTLRPDEARTILEAYADLGSAPAAESPCTAISSGYRFSARWTHDDAVVASWVPARLRSTAASAHPRGT